MINISEVPTRRILTFPAIRPCESASPATILSSLITLCSTICSYKSKSFPTNHLNAKKTIRLIGNLLFFLEEIRIDESGFSGSVLLSLWELHFVLQKVHFLLEDCTRGDARVWMLLRSEKVSNQFRVLNRAVGVALDVLPFEAMDVSFEVKELFCLVKRQALTGSFDIRPEDKRVLEKTHLILNQLENGIAPGSKDLKWVLDSLGISSWSECNKEVKFLDSEIGSERSTSKKPDLGILSTLKGLMTLCRCTLFNAVDSEKCSDHGGSGNPVITALNVDDFKCPISLEIMTDPVIITTGHTYDRSSIQKWFSSGNATCPKTGEKVKTTNLLPNLALKCLINQYCIENGIPVAESGCRNRDNKVVSGSVAAEAAMKMVANFLVGKLEFGTSEERNKGAYEIRLLTKTSIFNRSCLVEAGVVPILLDFLCPRDPIIQENAIAALLNLSKYSKTKKILIKNSGLEKILEVVENGIKIEARQHAAGVLFYLASAEEYRIKIGEIPNAIPALMDLVMAGSDRRKKNGLVAIFALLMCPKNHWRALSAGIVPLVVDLLGSCQREDIITDCLAILATLADQLDGSMAILSSVLSSGALDIIVGILIFSTSRTAKEYCVTLLLALCINGGADVVQVLVKNPSLVRPLYSQLTNGSTQSSKKASLLIRILHEFNEKSSSAAFRGSPFLQERVIDVL